MRSKDRNYGRSWHVAKDFSAHKRERGSEGGIIRSLALNAGHFSHFA